MEEEMKCEECGCGIGYHDDWTEVDSLMKARKIFGDTILEGTLSYVCPECHDEIAENNIEEE